MSTFQQKDNILIVLTSSKYCDLYAGRYLTDDIEVRVMCKFTKG